MLDKSKNTRATEILPTTNDNGDLEAKNLSAKSNTTDMLLRVTCQKADSWQPLESGFYSLRGFETGRWKIQNRRIENDPAHSQLHNEAIIAN